MQSTTIIGYAMELLLYAKEAKKNPREHPIFPMEYLTLSTVLDE